ncbi:MAG: DUF4446 family protein [Minisyncoccales bacterium]
MFNFFNKKEKPDNFNELVSKLEKLETKLDKTSEKLEDLEDYSRCFVNNVGITRYNPFKHSGGNQSFSVAILDSFENGVVITSLYSREGNRVYAKPIKQGDSDFSLSDEERKAIKKAKNYDKQKS